LAFLLILAVFRPPSTQANKKVTQESWKRQLVEMDEAVRQGDFQRADKLGKGLASGMKELVTLGDGAAYTLAVLCVLRAIAAEGLGPFRGSPFRGSTLFVLDVFTGAIQRPRVIWGGLRWPIESLATRGAS